MKKGWEKVGKGHLESSRKRLPLLGGRRYVASTPKGVGGDVSMKGKATYGERGEGGSTPGVEKCMSKVQKKRSQHPLHPCSANENPLLQRKGGLDCQKGLQLGRVERLERGRQG